MSERRQSFRPEVRTPLTKPISVKIEKGTISWRGERVPAERIRSYQEGKQVGQIIRRIVCGHNEQNDALGTAVSTFRVDEKGHS